MMTADEPQTVPLTMPGQGDPAQGQFLAHAPGLQMLLAEVIGLGILLPPMLAAGGMQRPAAGPVAGDDDEAAFDNMPV